MEVYYHRDYQILISFYIFFKKKFLQKKKKKKDPFLYITFQAQIITLDCYSLNFDILPEMLLRIFFYF